MNGRLEPFLTVCDAARLLKVSRASLYREINDGRLKAVRIRNVLRIAMSELDNYLRRNETK